MGFSQTLKASDDEIPDSDVGEILHPVFSPMLHSSHKTAWHQTFEELSEILPDEIGLTPVQVVNHTMQWEDFDKNPDIRSSDTYVTKFERLATLTDDRDMDCLEVLGLAITAANDIVKKERVEKYHQQANPFQCKSTTQSMLTSAGFSFTEEVAVVSTPHPDDDSNTMSLALRFGGKIPNPPAITKDATEVKVKTTRVVIQIHTHQSKVLKVDDVSMLPEAREREETVRSIKLNSKLNKTVSNWINKQPVSTSVQTDYKPTTETATQYSPTDEEQQDSESITMSNTAYDNLFKSLFKHLVNFHKATTVNQGTPTPDFTKWVTDLTGDDDGQSTSKLTKSQVVPMELTVTKSAVNRINE